MWGDWKAADALLAAAIQSAAHSKEARSRNIAAELHRVQSECMEEDSLLFASETRLRLSSQLEALSHPLQGHSVGSCMMHKRFWFRMLSSRRHRAVQNARLVFAGLMWTDKEAAHNLIKELTDVEMLFALSTGQSSRLLGRLNLLC